MATVVEQRTQPLGAYDFEHVRLSGPQFNNPWDQPGSQYYQQSQAPSQQQQQISEPYARHPYNAVASHTPQVDVTSQPRSFPAEYSSAADTTAYTATSSDRHPEQFAQAYNYESRYPVQYTQSQQAQAVQPVQPVQPASRQFRPSMAGREFSDALDASHGMMAMRQQDYTPRGQYAPRSGTTESYGFPSGQSDHGSISSASSYPYYGSYNNSVEGSVAGSSVTDYSSASEDHPQRTLPPPGQLLGGYPADATQMMNQFNSKLAPNAQKKHKCKICEKRFTRPSSLQTHMYSHTGEKPFACDFPGCGRHFSVVSNLRRHKKCHKGENGADASSPDA